MSFKSGFVTIIGRPNVGKSTLLNALTGEKIAITSNKPQTTRNVIRTVITDENSQIIFVDTPGIHKPKTKLGEYMVSVAVETLNEVDVVLFLIDSAEKNAGPSEREIIEKLKLIKTPVYLVMNKIDNIDKQDLLPVIANFSELMNFKRVIPISALKNQGVDILLNEIRKELPTGPKYFPDDMLTDQPEKIIVAEIIREKILRLTDEEVPHGIGVEVISFKERQGKDLIDIEANIYCEKDTHKAILIGKGGKMLKDIGSKAREDIEKLLSSKIFLNLWVKVKPDWRNSEFMLKSLGYKKQK